MNYKTILIGIAVVIVVLQIFIYFEMRKIPPMDFPEENSLSDFDSDVALLTHTLDGWSFNEYNPEEILMDVSVYNYGYSEAKNVEIRCDMFNNDEFGYMISTYPIVTVFKKVGNVASTSYTSTQLSAMKNEIVNDYSTYSCEIVSCENCEVLDDRLLTE